MSTKGLVFYTFKLPPRLAINKEMLLLLPESQVIQHREMHCCVTSLVPDRLSLGVEARAASYTITRLTRLSRDTGLENYGIKNQCWVQSIGFQADLMGKENSIKQLHCT